MTAIDRDELCRKLGCDEAELEMFIHEGMPWHGDASDPEFDEAEIATWLFVNGKATIDTTKVARTATDAARRLDVSRQTLHTWAKMDGFPGCPGFYPIDEIMAWNAARNRKVNQYAREADIEVKQKTKQGLSIKERRDLIKLKREEGSVIDADEVKRMLTRLGSYLVSELNTLAGRIECDLPAGFDEEATAVMCETTKRVVNECREIISEFQIWGPRPEADTEDAEQTTEPVH